jgi:hypothetical protein
MAILVNKQRDLELKTVTFLSEILKISNVYDILEPIDWRQIVSFALTLRSIPSEKAS